MFDSLGTIRNATRGRRRAQALGAGLLAVLCLVLAGLNVYAGDAIKIKRYSLQTLSKLYIHNSTEYRCFNYIITRESHWNPKARNNQSTAYGIGQLLNEKSEDSFEQVVDAMAYMRVRYGTICNAMRFHLRHWWY